MEPLLDGSLDLAARLAALPPEWPTDLQSLIDDQLASHPQTIVVLDDDPTGTQTVFNIPVLTDLSDWSVDAIAAELAFGWPALYLLTNSRSMPLAQAQELNTRIGQHLARAAAQANRAIRVVSRSDSTLRGHFPGEVAALAEGLDDRQSPWLIVPFFLEGGRYTIDNIHYVAQGQRLIPAGATAFARDASFGYHASNLREWVAEKYAGQRRAEEVGSISLADLRQGGPEQVARRLLEITDGAICIVNAASYRDMQVLVAGLLIAESHGRSYLYRTAASFVRVRAGIEAHALLQPADLQLPAVGGGLVMVGSYVPTTSAQLEQLLASGMLAVEIDVAALADPTRQAATIAKAAQQTDAALQQGRDVVVYTSRQLITGADAAASLAIGRRISDGLCAILRALMTRPRYLIAKGGITSSDLATIGLGVRRALVLGQILPGVPVWRTGAESRHPDLIYIVFPGNVGGPTALVDVVRILSV